jgi:hypothetical protein
MQPDLFALLFSVIGVAWLTIVPTYRGWGGLNAILAQRVETSAAALRETTPVRQSRHKIPGH